MSENRAAYDIMWQIGHSRTGHR